jgi:hypothetical protein
MDKINFLELPGNAFERGRLHGQKLSAVIAGVIGRWEKRLDQAFGVKLGDYVRFIGAQTGFRKTMEQWAPDLLEEVRGISEGTGVDPDLMFTWQLIDEHSFCIPNHKGEGCSTIGVVKERGRRAYIAQNLDLPLIKDNAQALLKISGHGDLPGMLCATQAGAVAAMGMNQHGLGVCVNALPQLATSDQGLPVSFIVRKILEQKNLMEAKTFIHNIPHATGQNYLIGSPQGVACFECSAQSVAEYQGDPAGRWICHANHPMANRDTRELSNTGPDIFGSTTQTRQAFLGIAAARVAKNPDVPSIKEVLKDRTVCFEPASGQGNFTGFSVIMELSADPIMHIAAGPPSKARFSRFGF